jgi:hypothetical protein
LARSSGAFNAATLSVLLLAAARHGATNQRTAFPNA